MKAFGRASITALFRGLGSQQGGKRSRYANRGSMASLPGRVRARHSALLEAATHRTPPGERG